MERIKSLRRFLKDNNIEHKILQNMDVKIFVISFNGTETKYLIPKAEKLYDQNGNVVLSRREKKYVRLNKVDFLLFNIADLWFYSKAKSIEKVENYYSAFVSFNILKFERKLDIKQNFVHLHNHFEFSCLDGSFHSSQWIDYCQMNGYDSIALTDHGTLSGIMDFYLNAKKKGFKPVLGYEAYITESTKNTTYNHLTLLAKNNTGWMNLMKLNTFANRKGFYRKPRITYKTLKKYSDGLIILTGCPSGRLSKLLWEDKFDDAVKLYEFYCGCVGEANVFMEVQYHTYSSNKDMEEQDRLHNNFFRVYECLKRKKYNPKIVITNDCHYIKKEDYEINKALKRISKDGYDSGCTDLYMKTREEILEDFRSSVFLREKLFKKSAIEEWMSRTVEIANMCDVSIETGVHYLPEYQYDKTKYNSNEEMFDDIIAKGYIQKVIRKVPKEKLEIYEARIKRESDFIKFAGFVDYFLIVWDVINYARSQNIMVGFSRGSVAGSLVAYCMSITEIDPIRFDLIFERFLNEARVSKERASATNSLPDIDCDFESAGRDKVKRYLEEKYGTLNVASLATYGKLKIKAAIKDIGRSAGIDYAYVNKVTRFIEDVSDDGDEWRNLAASMKNDVVNEFIENFPDVISLISKCQKHIRNSSIHAAGVVIAPRTIQIGEKVSKARLDSFIPVKMQSVKGTDEKIMVTEWEGDFAEKRGLVKLDILGIDQLDIFKEILRLIEKNHGKKIDLTEINLEDKKVYERFASGDTEGVFQFKSDSQRAYQKVLLPERFEHLMASNALIRPGTLANNTHMDYVDIKNGDKDVKYLKGMKEIMKPTYGLMIYEEQIMQIASHGGGFSLVDADIMRAAVKKANVKPELIPVMLSYKDSFMAGLKKIHGYTDKEAEGLWKTMENFLGYSFNKCLSGNTIVHKFTAGKNNKIEMTIEKYYDMIHIKGTSIYDKYKRQGHCGLIRRYDFETGTVRYGKIKTIHKNGIQKVYKITLKNGMSIEATLNHRFLTGKEKYKHVYDLKVGDNLMVCGDKIQSYEVGNKRLSGLGSGWTKYYVGHKSENDKPFIDHRTKKYNICKKIARKRAGDKCEVCLKTLDMVKKHSVEYHHKDGNHLNNKPSNIIQVCNSCHKKLDYEIGTRTSDRSRGFWSDTSKIVSIEYAGKKMTYDVEMMDEPHNFVANGIISHNSHACGYAYTSYCCQWLKVHYPAEFWTVNLQHDDKNRIDIVGRIMKDYKKINIKFPDINISMSDFHLKDKNIYWGLMHIKGVGEKGAKAIIRARKEKGKFTDLKDFFDKVEKRVINKRVVESLIYSGAFDNLYDIGDDYDKRHGLIETYYKDIRREKNIPERKDLIAEYKRLIGMTMINWDSFIEEKGIHDFVNMKEFEEVQNESVVSVAGIISSMKDYLPKGKTEEEDRMGFVTIEQNNYKLDLILWKDFWSLNKKKFKIGNMIVFRGLKRFDDFRKKHVLYSCNESKAYKLKKDK